MDEAIVKFEEQIVKDINESGLPLQVIRLVLGEIQSSIVAECNNRHNPVEKEENNGIQ